VVYTAVDSVLIDTDTLKPLVFSWRAGANVEAKDNEYYTP